MKRREIRSNRNKTHPFVFSLKFVFAQAVFENTGSSRKNCDASFLGICQGLGRVSVWLHPNTFDAVLVGLFKNRLGDGRGSDDGDVVLGGVAGQRRQIGHAGCGFDDGLSGVHGHGDIAMILVPS